MQHASDKRARQDVSSLNKQPRHAAVSARPYQGAYCRDRYGSGVLSDGRARRAKRRVPLVLKVIASLFLVIVLGLCGYIFWFSSQLDRALSSDKDALEGVEDVLVPVDPSRPFYALLLGSDSREGGYSPNVTEQSGLERSDVIMLVRVDAPNRKLTMISIPRDTPYELEDGTIVKINEMYNRYGAAGSIKAVSEVTGAPIGHFAVVGFSDLESIVDLLGGVEVDIDVELSYKDVHTLEQVTLQPGIQTINGQQAQIFARARHEYSDNQDMHRQNNVRALLMAVLKKTLDRPITEIPGIVLEEARHVTTSTRTGDLVSLALAFGSGQDLIVYSGTGPYDGDIVEYADGQWLCYRNPEGWARLMALVDAGEEPIGVDFAATQELW